MNDYNPFAELNDMITKAFTYTPLTDEQMQISYVNDLIEWADGIASEWNGDEAGSQENRAHCANDIIEKLNDVKALIEEMGSL